jgi:hypothetical protein
MTPAGHKTCKGEMKNINKNVVRKPERRGPPEGQDNIKMYFKNRI